MSYVSRGHSRPRLIFSRINGPNISLSRRVPLLFSLYTMRFNLSAVIFYCTFSFLVNFICYLLFHLISNSLLSFAMVWRNKFNKMRIKVKIFQHEMNLFFHCFSLSQQIFQFLLKLAVFAKIAVLARALSTSSFTSFYRFSKFTNFCNFSNFS